MRVAICIDSWKLSIFTRHLDQAGYTNVSVSPFVTPDALMLAVDTPNVVALQTVLQAAVAECKMQGRRQ